MMTIAIVNTLNTFYTQVFNQTDDKYQLKKISGDFKKDSKFELKELNDISACDSDSIFE